ncbi:uncharacterized protein LOC110932026 [Helianthus annuus]|uniref:uncharacterized protein LOC110932026 n=1 Tax=Helianthus annuus TaxID=4232 RepID=UPI000B900D8C|nr:uncharacterized protein LOC110932026 [Helianthus annuus]
MSSSSSSSDGVLVDMVTAMAQEAINYLQEAESSASRTRQPPIERNRLAAHERLVQDYFCETPVYDDDQFKRRFRMSRRLFVKISNDLAGESPFFTRRVSASGKVGFSGLQKCTVAIRQLAYGTSSDAWDEYLRMSSRMCRESLENFCEDGVAPDTSFYANDVQYKYGYYLTDGIYPEWATLVKSPSCPDDEKRLYFKKKQESARKDIERAFGVLKKRWSIITQPSKILEKSKMRNVIYTCIILHNMILEDSGRAFCGESYDESIQPTNPILTYAEKEDIRAKIRARHTHQNLRADLTEHLWFYLNKEDSAQTASSGFIF